MDVNAIIDKFYPKGSKCREILIAHSSLVAQKAIALAKAHPELNVDIDFVGEASLIHDIGVYLCNAPGIECYGSEPYIRHGVLGAEIMRREGYEKHARVCERHTGAGLTKQSILEQGLPLPAVDLLPQTIEEKLICFADKFFSKSRPTEEKSLEHARRSISKFGQDSLARFNEWCELFL